MSNTKRTGQTVLYERLSRDDEMVGDSNSIINQKKMLEDYANKNGYTNILHFTDDGYSGGSFERPSYYLAQRGMRNHISNYNSTEPYLWRGTTISNILSRPEYMGHTVNFRTYKESYKSHRNKKTPKEDWVIFENTQEAIIDEETFNTVQKLRKTIRRTDSVGIANPLTGLVYCADCGAKMYNHRGKAGFKRDWLGRKTDKRRPLKDEYICSTYNLARGNFEEKCSSHYIQSEVINKLVLDTIKEVSEYVKLNEEEFIKKVYSTSKEQQEKTSKLLKKRLAKEEKRIYEINSLIRKLYEDNVSGKLSNKHFDMMLKDFEKEQTVLEKSIEQTKDTLRDFEEDSIRADKFIALVKKYTDFSELTTQMINEFVYKIVVHEEKWENCERTQEVEIYLNFIGKFEMPKKEPTKEEVEELEKLKKKREKKREYNYRYMKKVKERMKTGNI